MPSRPPAASRVFFRQSAIGGEFTGHDTLSPSIEITSAPAASATTPTIKPLQPSALHGPGCAATSDAGGARGDRSSRAAGAGAALGGGGRPALGSSRTGSRYAVSDEATPSS